MNKPNAFFTDGKLRIPTPEELGFDPAEMRRKYDSERDRRLRSEGAAQYQDIVSTVTGAIQPAIS